MLLPAMDVLDLGSVASVRRVARPDSMSPTTGMVCTEVTLSIPDAFHLNSSSSSRFTAYLGCMLPAVQWSHPGALLAPRSTCCIKPASSMPTCTRLSIVMPAPEDLQLGAALFLQDVSCSEKLAVALDYLHSDIALLLQDMAKPDSLLSVPDGVHLGLPSAAHTSACIEPAVLVWGIGQVGTSLSVSSFFHLGTMLALQVASCPASFVILFRNQRLGIPTTTSGSMHLGSLLLTSKLSQLDMVPAMADLLNLDALLSARSFS